MLRRVSGRVPYWFLGYAIAAIPWSSFIILMVIVSKFYQKAPNIGSPLGLGRTEEIRSLVSLVTLVSPYLLVGFAYWLGAQYNRWANVCLILAPLIVKKINTVYGLLVTVLVTVLTWVEWTIFLVPINLLFLLTLWVLTVAASAMARELANPISTIAAEIRMEFLMEESIEVISPKPGYHIANLGKGGILLFFVFTFMVLNLMLRLATVM